MINKLYIKLDETNTIQGYFKQFTEKPESGKVFKIGCNFDETTDFEKAIVVENLDESRIIIGESKIVNGYFIEKPENV